MPPTDSISIRVNGTALSVSHGTTVAAAVFAAGTTKFRRSVTGEPRAPLCGMGICYECRVTINGSPHAKSCQILCAGGMDVHTDD
jgi:D-hydroxyproline dehydrogenase subunit gamma